MSRHFTQNDRCSSICSTDPRAMQRTKLWSRRRALVSVAILAIVAVMAASAQAQTLGLDITGPGGLASPVTGPAYTLGWEFAVNTAVTIDELGVWDESPTGLSNSHSVVLWTTAGLLKASVSIATGTSVASASPDGEWRFESIPPLVLQPGNYVLGATFVSSGDASRAVVTTSTPDEITFVGNRECTGGCSGLTFPANSNIVDDGYFGPNLRFSPPPVPTTVPIGLNPGDSYRLAFATSTARDAVSTDIADYNAFVTAVANTVAELAALGTNWKAIGTTQSVDARDNTNTNPNVEAGVPIYLTDGTLLVNDNADLWDASIAVPIGIDEYGSAIASSLVWTGSDTSGISVGFGELGNPFLGVVVAGDSTSAASEWVICCGGDAPSNQHPLYAISDVLTVPIPVPALPIGGIGALGGLMSVAAGWTLRRGRRRARD